GVWVRGEIAVQRLARKRDQFSLERRCGRQCKTVGRRQGRPAHGLAAGTFFDEHVLFLAADLHGKCQAYASARYEKDAVADIAKVEQFRAGGEYHALAESEDA